MFYGVPARENEDCENLIKALISEKLELSRAESIPFDRMHRVGLFSHLVAGLCHFVFSRRRRKNAMRKDEKRHAKRRIDEITPCEKTKRRNPPHEKTKFQREKTKKRHAKRRHLKLYFCRLFAWCLFVFLSFRLALFSPRKDEKTPCEKTKLRYTKRRNNYKTINRQNSYLLKALRIYYYPLD